MLFSFICSPLSAASTETGRRKVDVGAIKSYGPSRDDSLIAHALLISAVTGNGRKKTGSPKSRDISATRLSPGDPIGFPPHSREWFSIIVYHHLIYTDIPVRKPSGINVRLSRR